jgi:hypothetical protein
MDMALIADGLERHCCCYRVLRAFNGLLTACHENNESSDLFGIVPMIRRHVDRFIVMMRRQCLQYSHKSVIDGPEGEHVPESDKEDVNPDVKSRHSHVSYLSDSCNDSLTAYHPQHPHQ